MTSSRSLLQWSALGMLLSVAILSRPALGQLAGWIDPDDPGICTATIPESQMTRVAIYASPVIAVPSDSARSLDALTLARDLTSAVAGRVRQMLGATGREIPNGEPAVQWRGARTSFRVTAHRDGSIKWRDVHRVSMTPARTADTLLARALTMVRDSSPRIPWPKGVKGATIAFDIVLDGVKFDRNEVGFPPALIDPQPVFSVMQPWMEPARPVRRGRISYPMRGAYYSVGGSLRVRFLVDTAGRVDMSTVTDVWPEDRPRLKGDMGDYYRSFLAAVRRPLNGDEFVPARIGGCAVKSWVEEFHDFTIIYR